MLVFVLANNTKWNRLLSFFVIHKQDTWFWQLGLFPLQEFGEHPNIIKLLDVIRAQNDKDIYLVFESMGETALYQPLLWVIFVPYFDSSVLMTYMNILVK